MAHLRSLKIQIKSWLSAPDWRSHLPEIVSQVRHYMKLHVHRQELQAAFTGNVRFTKNFFLRAVPVFLKNPVMALNYYLFGVRPSQVASVRGERQHRLGSA